jgi:hypothetical protein
MPVWIQVIIDGFWGRFWSGLGLGIWLLLSVGPGSAGDCG